MKYRRVLAIPIFIVMGALTGVLIVPGFVLTLLAAGIYQIIHWINHGKMHPSESLTFEWLGAVFQLFTRVEDWAAEQDRKDQRELAPIMAELDRDYPGATD